MGNVLNISKPNIRVVGVPIWVLYDDGVGGRFIRLFRLENGVLNFETPAMIGIPATDTIYGALPHPTNRNIINVITYRAASPQCHVYQTTSGSIVDIGSVAGGANDIRPTRLYYDPNTTDLWLLVGSNNAAALEFAEQGIYRYIAGAFVRQSAGHGAFPYGALQGEVSGMFIDTNGDVYVAHTFTFDAVPAPDTLYIISRSVDNGATFTDIQYGTFPNIAQGPGLIFKVNSIIRGLINRDATGATEWTYDGVTFSYGVNDTSAPYRFADGQSTMWGGPVAPVNTSGRIFYVSNPPIAATKSTYKLSNSGGATYSASADLPIGGPFHMPYNGVSFHATRSYIAIANDGVQGNIALSIDGGDTFTAITIPGAANIRALAFAHED